MSNDCGSIETEENIQDEEVNCVFCGKLFPSVERVQEHISLNHEAVEVPSENIELKIETVLENKQLRVFDLNTELIINKVIDYNGVVQCSKCDLLFVNVYASRIHFEKVHLGRKRKRSNNPNGVKKMIPENKFREILPNSKRTTIDKSVNEGSSLGNNKLQNGCHEERCSLPVSRRPTGNLWQAAQATSRGNKIVISRVYQSEVPHPGGTKIKYGFLQKAGYSCFYCREIFLNKESFKRHLLLHRLNKCFKCRNCGSKFQRVKMLKQHQKYNCHIEFINSSGPRESNGVYHIKSEVCRILPKTTDRQTLQHIKVEPQSCKSLIQYKEDEVSSRDIKFAEKFLNNSSITLNKGSQCVCNLCQSCFYSNNSILRHLVLYHRIAAQDGSTALTTKSNHRPLKAKSVSNDLNSDVTNLNNKPTLHFIHNCDHCESQFASKKGLQRHLYSVHMIQTLDSKYKDDFRNELTCSECHLSFNDISSFDIHKEECSGRSSSPGINSRRVKCDTCGRRFRNPVTLEEHKRIHENYVCVRSSSPEGEVDNKSDKPDTALFPHLNEKVKHRGGNASKKSLLYTIPAYKKAKVPPNSDGLFECDVCHKTFTCRSSLSNHVKSHFNFKNKPFSCSSCDQGFMSTLTLQHHREQLCPNMNNNSNSNGDANSSNICSVESVPQTAIFSSFDGVSQIPGSNYSTIDGDRSSMYVGNSNLTTRATSCMHCSAMFPDRSLLEDHASKEHSNHAGEVVCIICPRSFTTYMAFRVHMTKSHGGPNGTSLKSHLNTANSLMKTTSSFELTQELSTSITKDNLRASAASPNGKTYHSRHSCPNCDKDFSTSQALGNHKRACMPHLYKKVSL